MKLRVWKVGVLGGRSLRWISPWPARDLVFGKGEGVIGVVEDCHDVWG